ncbi:MAG: transketolase C-terminal domain-containing protein [Candidatus Omnitrophota bacterium]
MRKLTYAQAILEATDQCLANDDSVYIIGLGVTDPKGVFGTTLGLEKKYGKRAMDMPVAENGMTGIAIGSSLVGMRPILTHQRVDFMILSLDQIINNAAKWHYMFGGKLKVPLVIRLLIGRGWGQGPQHSQNLNSIFAFVPGLKVVMPATAYDAKGLLISAIEDDNPVIFIEHRWLYGISDNVPEKMYREPLGKARIIEKGKDVTIISSSYMVLEAMRAGKILKKYGIGAEVLDLRSIRPLDEESIIRSVKKTGRLVVVDGAWRSFGISAEVIALVAEKGCGMLKSAPRRITFPDTPTPTSPALAKYYYPRAIDIVNSVRSMFGFPEKTEEGAGMVSNIPLDVPDKTFTGPF